MFDLGVDRDGLRSELSRKKAWLRAAVITEHDGSITAVIRHQTKGTSRAGRRGRGRGGRMVLVTPALSQGLLMKCQPRSTRKEVSGSVAPERLQTVHFNTEPCPHVLAFVDCITLLLPHHFIDFKPWNTVTQ